MTPDVGKKQSFVFSARERGCQDSPSPDIAALAAGDATLFRLAGLSEEPESML